MVMVPDSIVSSRLMARQSVDLPDPDGPRTTTTSPLRTTEVDVLQHVQMPRSACRRCSSTTSGSPRWSRSYRWAGRSRSALGLEARPIPSWPESSPYGAVSEWNICVEVRLRVELLRPSAPPALRSPDAPGTGVSLVPGGSTIRSSWVGPGLKASGPQVMGSTAIDQSRYGPPVKICTQPMVCVGPELGGALASLSRTRHRPSASRCQVGHRGVQVDRAQHAARRAGRSSVPATGEISHREQSVVDLQVGGGRDASARPRPRRSRRR